MDRALSAEGMAERDRDVIERIGVPAAVLIEAAAGACLAAVRAERTTRASGRVLVVAGPGNNGADGVAIARRLQLAGDRVECVVLSEAGEGELGRQLGQASRAGVVVTPLLHEEAVRLHTGRWVGAAVIVDALFGTGLARPLEGRFAAAVEGIRQARSEGARVVAVDLPSGIHATTGASLGTHVVADRTVTFAAPRMGHFLGPGKAARGKLEVADIGVPAAGGDGAIILGPRAVRDGIGALDADAHKGVRGHVLVVAGGAEKRGAAVLAAMGAMGAGAGWVTLATPLLPGAIIPQLPPEVMLLPLPAGRDGSLSTDAVQWLWPRLPTFDAIVVGPGLGLGPAAAALIRRLAFEGEAPAVLDADALTVLATLPRPWPAFGGPRVLTPHPGEMARLCGRTSAEVQRRRPEVARSLATACGGMVLIKGAGSLVLAPDGQMGIVVTGGPALSTAGTGDVLAGVVGALLARRIPPFVAAGVGAAWHGLAGDRAAADRGQWGVRASDVAAALGPSWFSLDDEAPPWPD